MSRHRETWFALLSAVTALAIPSFGQPKQVQFVQIPVVTEEHLRFFRLLWPSTRVVTRKVIQDNQGFLWLGAADGLRRYDGYSFMRVSEDEDGKTVGFINSESLMKDHSGAFWFGIDGFLARYDPASGHLRRYRTIGGPACRESGCDAHQITEDREGFIWLATNNGLIRLDPVTSRRTYYRHRPDDDATIASDTVICTIEGRDGLLWVATSGALDAFDRHTAKVTRRIRFEAASAGHLSLEGFPASLYEDRSGMLWAGLSSGGDLASIDPKTGNITVCSFRVPGSKKSVPAFVVSIAEDQEGALLLGTTGMGLLKIEPNLGRAVWYESNPEDPNSLSADLVVGLFRDREGSFWAHTKGGDVLRFDPGTPVFRSYRHEPGNNNSLIDSAVISAYEDSNGILWIGTERGLNRVDRRAGQVKRYGNVEFAPGVRSIAEDRSGSLWFGTRGNGLVRFDRRTEAMRTFRHRRDDHRSLSNDYVAALLVDRHGILWAATDDGLNRYDEKGEQFQSFKPDENNPTRYHSIAEDPTGGLWLASSEFGLHRFRPSTGEFTQFHSKPGDGGALSHDHVYSVYADKSGTIWAATFVGLDKFNPAAGNFTHYNARDGLPTNTALGVLEDERGYLWISTPDGLARFDPRTATGVSYHTADGLPTDLFNTLVVAVKAGSGEMFFGSYTGLIAFFPKQVIDHSFTPPVVLTNFRLFGELLPTGKGPLNQPIWSAKSIELPPNSIFSFDFSALSYIDPARTRYRYRLVGLESKWNETEGNRRVAAYTTLSPGHYTLQVQARTNRGDWTDGGASLNIYIAPAFYQRSWFYGLCAVILLALLWAAHLFRVRHLQREFKRLRDVIETIPAMAWTALPDGSNAFVNKRWAEYTGLSAEDTAGSGWTGAVHPEDLQPYAEKWRASLASGEPFESEARFRSATTGEYRWLLARSVPLREEHGNIVRWYGILTDIEDLKRAEETLRQSETRFRTFVDHVGDAILIQDEQGIIVEVNRQGCEGLGYTRQEVVGMTPSASFCLDADREAVEMEWVAQRAAVGETLFDRHRHRRKDGTEFPVEVHTTLFWYGGRRFLLKVVRDISESLRAEKEREKLRQVEHELRHVNRVSSMGALVASLSHDINQPITAVITSAKACLRWLERDPPELERARAAATRIERDGERAAETIARVRAFYKKGAPPQPELLDVNEVAREMIDLLHGEATRYSISIRTRLDEELPQVWADHVQLQQVFMNLMLNAIEAMQETAGELTIKSQLTQGGEVQISVSDTGVGLPADTIDRIFSAYFTTKEQGSGMGLAISRSIIESHSGRLWACANAGPGATFHFSLPIKSGAYA